MLRVAVLSDLHFYVTSEVKDAPSKLSTSGGLLPDGEENPLDGLRSLLKSEGSLTADLILCPGDITNQASQAAMSHGWKALDGVKQWLKAPTLLSATGNHEVISRPPDGAETIAPIDYLQDLTPPYPLADEALRNDYWANGFTIVSESTSNVVLLNSCHYHSTTQPSEFRRGRVGDRALKALRERLKTTPTRDRINILLCHHHPIPHAGHALGEADLMYGGERLMAVLEESGSWLVIHGHKHFPKLRYSTGESSIAPVVFSAGSFSGNLVGGIESITKNQFYLLDLSFSQSHRCVIGAVRSWWWSGGGVGWTKATAADHGIADQTGFGVRLCLPQHAALVNDAYTESHYIEWEELCVRVDDLRYMLPKDLRSLADRLSDSFDIQVTFDGAGRPSQVGRKVKKK